MEVKYTNSIFINTDIKDQKWANRFMSLAYFVAQFSEDENTKIGAVIVGNDLEPISWGFNGLPRGVKYLEERNQKPNPKYFFYEHGERNAILNAARIGTCTKGSTLYTQGTPCAECARAIIQAGINKVVVHKEWDDNNPPKWAESASYSRLMFGESGVVLESKSFPNLINKIQGFHDGKIINLG